MLVTIGINAKYQFHQHCVPTGRRSFYYTVFYQYVVPNGTKIGIILQSMMPSKFRNNQKSNKSQFKTLLQHSPLSANLLPLQGVDFLVNRTRRDAAGWYVYCKRVEMGYFRNAVVPTA
jgi:hypothetical protein